MKALCDLTEEGSFSKLRLHRLIKNIGERVHALSLREASRHAKKTNRGFQRVDIALEQV